MTIQQNIDYRLSVLDKVGVKITDTDGTQRPITSDDFKADKFEIAELDDDLVQYVWIVSNYLSILDEDRFIFSNKKSAIRKFTEIVNAMDSDIHTYEITKHEVLS